MCAMYDWPPLLAQEIRIALSLKTDVVQVVVVVDRRSCVVVSRYDCGLLMVVLVVVDLWTSMVAAQVVMDSMV